MVSGHTVFGVTFITAVDGFAFVSWKWFRFKWLLCLSLRTGNASADSQLEACGLQAACTPWAH